MEDRERIDLGKLTDAQIALFEGCFDHFEAFPGDVDRIRAVLKDGRKGPWFSRFWKPVPWNYFWPRD